MAQRATQVYADIHAKIFIPGTMILRHVGFRHPDFTPVVHPANFQRGNKGNAFVMRTMLDNNFSWSPTTTGENHRGGIVTFVKPYDDKEQVPKDWTHIIVERATFTPEKAYIFARFGDPWPMFDYLDFRRELALAYKANMNKTLTPEDIRRIAAQVGLMKTVDDEQHLFYFCSHHLPSTHYQHLKTGQKSS